MMKIISMLQSIRSHLPWLLAASITVACGDDRPNNGDEAADDATDATGTAGPEDEIGDGDATTTTGTTDDDTITTTTDDDGCSIGMEGCECTQGGGCDPGLECTDGLCTAPNLDTTDATDDVAETTETGSTLCEMDVSFAIDAIEAFEVDGWEASLSMLGEGMIMAWEQGNEEASIHWEIDVPCDDTWHIWIRGLDQGQNDSYFVTIDGEPNPEAIYELDCTDNPNQGTYMWKELNYRDQADPSCTYLLDPWTQDWLTGAHQFALSYRESIAVSKLWITNTELPPP
jgi:hypothetical protein